MPAKPDADDDGKRNQQSFCADTEQKSSGQHEAVVSGTGIDRSAGKTNQGGDERNAADPKLVHQQSTDKNKKHVRKMVDRIERADLRVRETEFGT